MAGHSGRRLALSGVGRLASRGRPGRADRRADLGVAHRRVAGQIGDFAANLHTLRLARDPPQRLAGLTLPGLSLGRPANGDRLPRAIRSGTILDFEAVGLEVRLRDLPSHDDLAPAAALGGEVEFRGGRIDHHAQPRPVAGRRLDLSPAIRGPDHEPILAVVAARKMNWPLSGSVRLWNCHVRPRLVETNSSTSAAFRAAGMRRIHAEGDGEQRLPRIDRLGQTGNRPRFRAVPRDRQEQ